MSTLPPNTPRRRIAGESKPGDRSTTVAKAPKIPKLPKVPSPAAGLPKAPTRTDAPKPSRVAKPPVSTRGWALIGVTIAALMLGVSGIVAGVMHNRGEDAGVTREDASDAAAAAAETIFTYQWNQLKQHLTASQQLMTPRFAKKFESISPALSALAPQRRIQVKAVVRNSATEECGDRCVEGKAKVLVFLDQARVADGSDTPTVFGNRIEMSMVKRDGDWLVDNVKAL